MKITIIGAGSIGGSLTRGWIRAGIASELTITAKTQDTLDKFSDYRELKTSLDNKAAVKDADIVVLAVKPWLIDDVISEIASVIEGKIVVNVAARVKNDRIDVYAMPNIAAEYGQSITFLAKSENTKDEDMEKVKELFSMVGDVMLIDERNMDAGMKLAGCGIAYAMRYIRASMEAGVEMGFYPKDSLQIVLRTVQGAVTLLSESGLHPEAAIDKVTTPGGVTIKGLNELDHNGFNYAVVRCFKA